MTLDLDAFLAEQGGEPFTFVFGGEKFELPPTMDVRAAADLDAGRLEAALRRLMGDKQWDRLMAVEAVFDNLALAKLLFEYGQHGGSSLGESLASIASSLNGTKRSRQTSKRTTRSR